MTWEQWITLSHCRLFSYIACDLAYSQPKEDLEAERHVQRGAADEKPGGSLPHGSAGQEEKTVPADSAWRPTGRYVRGGWLIKAACALENRITDAGHNTELPIGMCFAR